MGKQSGKHKRDKERGKLMESVLGSLDEIEDIDEIYDGSSNGESPALPDPALLEPAETAKSEKSEEQEKPQEAPEESEKSEEPKIPEEAEEPEETEEEREEREAKESAERKARRTRNMFAGFAAALLVFAVIGVISSIGFIRGVAWDIQNRTTLKNEFALFCYPVVMIDPPAFDSVDGLHSMTIITSALWKIILMEETEGFATDIGVIYVPEAAVERAANSIFGTGGLEHQSVISRGIQFLYSEETKTYQIPDNPMLTTYSPFVTAISNVGETYTVTIDYMPPSPLSIEGIERETLPVKTMIYTISRTSRERMTIQAIHPADSVGH